MGSGEDRHRRGRYDIWASILDLLIEEKRTLNGIRDVTRLNQERLKHHLDDMVSLGLVRPDRSGRFRTYQITEQGIQWREGYKGVVTGSLGKKDYGSDF